MDIPDYLYHARKAFESTEWFNNSTNLEIKENLLKVIKSLPSQRKNEFEECIEDIIIGYKLYLKSLQGTEKKEKIFFLEDHYRKCC